MRDLDKRRPVHNDCLYMLLLRGSVVVFDWNTVDNSIKPSLIYMTMKVTNYGKIQCSVSFTYVRRSLCHFEAMSHTNPSLINSSSIFLHN